MTQTHSEVLDLVVRGTLNVSRNIMYNPFLRNYLNPCPNKTTNKVSTISKSEITNSDYIQLLIKVIQATCPPSITKDKSLRW